jgi:predicted nucleotidyltransferase
VEGFLEELCRRLLECDEDVVEIIQFGSSVYGPEHSRDIDLFVVTKRVKEYARYLEAVSSSDLPVNIDILVFGVDERPSEGLLRGVLGAFKILYGSGEHLFRYARELGDPTFEEAESSLRVASSLLKLALETANPLDRDRLCREAFDALSNAARIASMVYLSTDVSRWGSIRRGLPEQHRASFDEFITTLHINYFYNGNYPKDRVKEEFDRWFRKVEEYVNSLQSEIERRA